MKILIILFFILFILLFVLYNIIISRKKVKKSNEKIENIIIYINEFLDKKNNLINKSKDIIKSEDYNKEFNDEDFSVDDMFMLNDLLNDYEYKLNAELFDNNELYHEKEVIEFMNDLKDVDINLNGTINYYNDNIIKYRGLKKNFFIKLFKIFCGVKNFKTFDIKKSNSMN